MNSLINSSIHINIIELIGLCRDVIASMISIKIGPFVYHYRCMTRGIKAKIVEIFESAVGNMPAFISVLDGSRNNVDLMHFVNLLKDVLID